MVQFDRLVTRHRLYNGTRTASSSTRSSMTIAEGMVDDASAAARAAGTTPTCCRSSRSAGLHPGRRGAAERRELRPGRTRADGQAERRRLPEEGRGRIRLHPKTLPDHLHREHEGALRVPYQYAEAGFVLTCRTPDGDRLRMVGDHRRQGHQPHRRHRISRDRRRQSGAQPEAARDRARPLHGHHGAAPTARFLSFMMGLFNARPAEGPMPRQLLSPARNQAPRRSVKSCSATW